MQRELALIALKFVPYHRVKRKITFYSSIFALQKVSNIFFFFLHEYMKQVTVSSESRKFNDDRTSVEFLQRRDKIRSFTRDK